MPQTVRTFIAIESTAAVQKRAANLIERLKAAQADVKWVAPENMHITVQFLGDVQAEQLPEVIARVERAAAKFAPFELQMQGAGAFPNTARPRTVFLGARGGNEQAATLAKEIGRPLAELGFKPEHRDFHAHLTLGRVRGFGRGLKPLSELLEREKEFVAGSIAVEELVVFSSTLTPKGSIYEALGRARLSGG
ncbi:MAG: RNA 2',3'-cyclic phosphodiesterase [Planctomycetota bacterium]